MSLFVTKLPANKYQQYIFLSTCATQETVSSCSYLGLWGFCIHAWESPSSAVSCSLWRCTSIKPSFSYAVAIDHSSSNSGSLFRNENPNWLTTATKNLWIYTHWLSGLICYMSSICSNESPLCSLHEQHNFLVSRMSVRSWCLLLLCKILVLIQCVFKKLPIKL